MGIDFCYRNNFANSGSFAKVSILDQPIIPDINPLNTEVVFSYVKINPIVNYFFYVQLV